MPSLKVALSQNELNYCTHTRFLNIKQNTIKQMAFIMCYLHFCFKNSIRNQLFIFASLFFFSSLQSEARGNSLNEMIATGLKLTQETFQEGDAEELILQKKFINVPTGRDGFFYFIFSGNPKRASFSREFLESVVKTEYAYLDDIPGGTWDYFEGKVSFPNDIMKDWSICFLVDGSARVHQGFTLLYPQKSFKEASFRSLFNAIKALSSDINHRTIQDIMALDSIITDKDGYKVRISCYYQQNEQGEYYLILVFTNDALQAWKSE